MISLLVYIMRCLIMVAGIWLVCIIIRKKGILQFTPYDLGILMIISNVIAQPLVNKDSFKTVIGILILAFGMILIGRLSLSKNFYKMDYSPSMVIANGVIDGKELKKNHLSLYSLLSLLRTQGYSKISEVNFAILELGGNLSVIPKTSARPLTVQDMNLNLPEEGFTFPVIMDGKIELKMLKYADLTEDWLKNELSIKHQTSIEKVFYAEVDANKKVFINLYDQSVKDWA